MTEEERLQEYLRQNQPKQKKEDSTEKISDKKRGSVTPEIWQKNRASYYFKTALAISLVGPVLLAGVFYGTNPNNLPNLIYFVVLALVLFLVFVLVWMQRANAYQRWIKGELYPLAGWDKFLANRSDLFWKGQYYTPIKIHFNFSPEAKQLHYDVVTVFLKKWEKKWEKYYRGVDYEMGSPAYFKASAFSFGGDIHQGGLSDIVMKMCFDVKRIADMLGNGLASVTITSSTNERELKVKDEKPDAYERQQRDI